MQEQSIQIVPADPSWAAELTQIALDAKCYWGYPADWIEQWIPDLTVDETFIAKHTVFAAWRANTLVGFYALVGSRPVLELEHMWVHSSMIGKGVGGQLFRHARNQALAMGAEAIEIDSDPNAEGFYRRMGAVRSGARYSRIKGQARVRPILTYKLMHCLAG